MLKDYFTRTRLHWSTSPHFALTVVRATRGKPHDLNYIEGFLLAMCVPQSFSDVGLSVNI
jgi:hypothetical protein